MHFCSSIFLVSIFFNFNGKLFKEDQVVVGPGNRGLRYGDGLFETMRVSNGSIRLKDLHFQRLFKGMDLLQFQLPKHFTPSMLQAEVHTLRYKNNYQGEIRVRLMIFRGMGGLNDPENHIPNYCIEIWPLSVEEKLNSNGLVIDIYHDVTKSCDTLSNLKTNNFLPYVMAALYVKKKQLNDALILNTYGRICDATIANIFMISGQTISTPSLSEGCVAGVMRQWLINLFPSMGYEVIEKVINTDDLAAAEGVFLTNAIDGIRWVKNFGKIEYSDKLVRQLVDSLPSRE